MFSHTNKTAKKLAKKATEGIVKTASEDGGKVVAEKGSRKINEILRGERKALTPKSKQMLDGIVSPLQRPIKATPASTLSRESMKNSVRFLETCRDGDEDERIFSSILFLTILINMSFRNPQLL